MHELLGGEQKNSSGSACQINFPGRLKLSAVLNRGGSRAKNFSSTVEELMEYHFPYHTQNRSVQDYTLGDGDPEFTQKEVATVFRLLNRGKAPGMDGIPLENVELLFRANKKLFVALLNKCLQGGRLSDSRESRAPGTL